MSSCAHKILDIIGDLTLSGRRLRGRIVAVKPGHGPNTGTGQGPGQERHSEFMWPWLPARRQPKQECLDINEIMRTLPHRYPFLMVDRIIEFQEDTRAVGVKAVTINEPYFVGHFPVIQSCRASCRSKPWRRWPAS